MWRLCIKTIHIPTRTETVAKQRGMLLQLSEHIRINITKLCNYSMHVLIPTALDMQCIAVYVYWIQCICSYVLVPIHCHAYVVMYWFQYIVVYMYLYTGSNTL